MSTRDSIFYHNDEGTNGAVNVPWPEEAAP